MRGDIDRMTSIRWLMAAAGICWVTTGLALTPAYLPEIEDVSPSEPVNGRMHLTIAVEMIIDPRVMRPSVDRAIVHGGGVSIVMSGEWIEPDAQDLTPPFEQSMQITLDNLPPGEYPLFLVLEDPVNGDFAILDGVTITVPADRRPELPMTVTTWPPDPTVLDDIWLLVEPVSFCSRLEGGLVITDAMIDGQPVSFEEIAVTELADDCPGPNEPPRLKALPLSGLGSGGVTNLVYSVDDTTQLSKLDLRVDDRLSPRMAGSWYNPEQSGHGITLEILDDGQLLLYWVTFDDQGTPAWIIAQGESDGTGASLDAQIVTGGRFPPEFDADAIERRDWGRIDLSFQDCNQAVMAWQPTVGGFSDGQMPLVRLSRPADQPCSGPPPASARIPEWYQGPGTFLVVPDAGPGFNAD